MNKTTKKAFTLIELLVVIAIIGILSGLIIFSTQGAIKKAILTKSQVFSNSIRNALLGYMISEWKFDGGNTSGDPATSIDVLDTWSGANNGNISPTPPTIYTGTDCISGSCLSFDGQSNYINFGSDSSLSMRTGDQTVSFWVYFENPIIPQFETILICGAQDVGQDGYWIRRSNKTRLDLYFSDGGSPIVGYLSNEDAFLENVWYHVVVVFDRDSVAQAYINGVKQDVSVDISSQQGDIINYIPFSVGAFPSPLHRLEGRIDEIRVYNAIIPIFRIQEQYYANLNKLFTKGAISSVEYYSRINEISSIDF